MSAKPKRKPKEKRKRDEAGRAEIEFVAPFSLADCLFRIRDMKQLDTGFISPGIDSSFEKIDGATYKFKIRRTWYHYRYPWHSSMVEVRGFLRTLEGDETVVIGKTRFSTLIYVVAIILVLLLVASLFLPSGDSKNSWFAIFPVAVVLIILIAQMYFDRRTLVRLIRKTLNGET